MIGREMLALLVISHSSYSMAKIGSFLQRCMFFLCFLLEKSVLLTFYILNEPSFFE